MRFGDKWLIDDLVGEAFPCTIAKTNKNLIFLSEDDVYKSLDYFHYMEIVSVDKQFPNVINVKVRERREVYYLDYGNHYLDIEWTLYNVNYNFRYVNQYNVWIY